MRSTQIRFRYLVVLVCITMFYMFLWRGNNEMMNPTVLLTGGLGFIGSHLVEELLFQGYSVIVFDDKSTGNNFNRNAITIIGDITNSHDFDKITYKIDYIVHFAAAISVAESMKDPAKYERINVQGSKNVLDWAVKHHVKKVISASSAAVYGVPLTLPINEDASTKPISPYAATKLTMEHIQKEYHDNYGIDCICLRFFNVFGPRQNPKSTYSGVISKFIGRATKGEPLTILGDGTNTRDFVYVKDVAKAVRTALQRGTGYKIYNVGTSTVTTITQLAKLVIELCASSSTIQYQDARDGDIKNSLANTTLITTELGWTPSVSLSYGLKETIRWYKSQ